MNFVLSEGALLEAALQEQHGIAYAAPRSSLAGLEACQETCASQVVLKESNRDLAGIQALPSSLIKGIPLSISTRS